MKPKGSKYRNERNTYQCDKCKEKFRLKMTLKTHKCKENIHRQGSQEVTTDKGNNS